MAEMLEHVKFDKEVTFIKNLFYKDKKKGSLFLLCTVHVRNFY